MNLLLCLKNKFKDNSAFTLLEVVLVITISTVLAGLFLELLLGLYADQNYFTAYSAWDLDAYLVVDFMAEQLKYSSQVELISAGEIHFFSYYNDSQQWLSYNLYQRENSQALARRLGGDDYLHKDFGRNIALIENVESIKFKHLENNLLEIELIIKENNEEFLISRLVYI